MQALPVAHYRHQRQSGLRFGLPTNALLWWGIALEVALILLIVYTRWGNALFGTAPLSSEVWLYVLPFVVGMGAAEEACKGLIRRTTAIRSQADGGRKGIDPTVVSSTAKSA